jgi:hypothetical protein
MNDLGTEAVSGLRVKQNCIAKAHERERGSATRNLSEREKRCSVPGPMQQAAVMRLWSSKLRLSRSGVAPYLKQ